MLVEQAVRHQDLAGTETGQIGCQPSRRGGLNRQLAGGDVGPGEGQLARPPQPRDGGEVIVAALVEQAVLGQRAGRHQPDDIAPHDGFRPALAGFGRILQLLADGHPVADADQLLQVTVRRMHRARRTWECPAPRWLAALGERDAQVARGNLGILEEELVEIAHAVEEQAAGIGRLDLQVLRHDRRGALVGGTIRTGLGGGPVVHAASISRKSGKTSQARLPIRGLRMRCRRPSLAAIASLWGLSSMSTEKRPGRRPTITDEEALQFHQQGKPGKLEITPTKPMATQRDLSLAYSPGVAVPVRKHRGGSRHCL